MATSTGNYSSGSTSTGTSSSSHRRDARGGHSNNNNNNNSNDPLVYAQQLVRDRVRTFYYSSPLSTCLLGTGLCLGLAGLTGLVPLRAASFHPRLAFAPAWQLHRIPLSVAVLGRSLPQFVGSVVSIVTWHAQLEALVCGTGDTVKDGRIVKRGSNNRSRKTIYEWLVSKNPFLKIQLALLVATTALELLLYSDPKDPLSAVYLSGSSVLSQTQKAVLVFPYSLFPIFDAAIRWTWAFMELEKDTLIFGVVPVRPIYVPLVTTLMGGGSFTSLLKGFIVSATVSTALKLRRGGADLARRDTDDTDLDLDDPPELVYEFLRDFGIGWYRWTKAVIKKLLNIRVFNVNDAATFFDVTVLPAIGPFVAEARDALVKVANEIVVAGDDGAAPQSSQRRQYQQQQQQQQQQRRRREDLDMENVEGEEFMGSGYSLKPR
ncbi:hypothetical protein BCR33DRAFT_850222 [Rhizoclosmatium globosum]|uniref:Uncharacterized protein n=1 Tax=Rhizoclosmatium globosum TaxID=329046 RepID=A0A1Y2CCD0_9FUNG|nr:hypothetical protein BCR33DRAFT_850222 [Rhizoclosmatium globosum]|eukprot:ORY44692.1 hypothetical protein BCR33DRAFT_850222 [Rhizoclosmatium globosum]